MPSWLCLLLPVLASQVSGGRYEPGDRVVEVNVRYAKEGMEEEFQLARKELSDLVRLSNIILKKFPTFGNPKSYALRIQKLNTS